MDKNSTLNDFIRYAYNETELPDSVRIQKSIDSDPLIQSQYNEVLECIGLMDKILIEPRNSTIDKILHYSISNKQDVS